MNAATQQQVEFDIHAVVDSMEWGEPFERDTADRKFTVRTAAPSEMFWQAWRKGKEALKGAGLFSTKEDGTYVVEWILPSGTLQLDKQLPATIDPVGKLPPGQTEFADPQGPPIVMVATEDLRENPINAQLYDPGVACSVLESVAEKGVLVPLRALRNGKLLDGHQRLQAARQSNWKKVPVIYDDREDSDSIEAILAYNSQRIKNNVELLRVFREYLRIEKGKANERTGLRTDVGSQLPDGHHEWGKARDLAAKKVGLSGSTAERGLRVLEEIERRLGTDDHAKEAREKLLTQGVNAAYKYAHSLGWIDAVVKPRPKNSKNAQAEQSQPSVENAEGLPDGQEHHADDGAAAVEVGWLTDEIVCEISEAVAAADFDLRGFLTDMRPMLLRAFGSVPGESCSANLRCLSKALTQLAKRCSGAQAENQTSYTK